MKQDIFDRYIGIAILIKCIFNKVEKATDKDIIG